MRYTLSTYKLLLCFIQTSYFPLSFSGSFSFPGFSFFWHGFISKTYWSNWLFLSYSSSQPDLYTYEVKMLKLRLMWIRYNKCQSYIAVQFFSVVYLEIEQQERCSLSASLSVYGHTLVYLHKDFCDFVSFICLNGTSSSVVYLYFQVLK